MGKGDKLDGTMVRAARKERRIGSCYVKMKNTATENRPGELHQQVIFFEGR